MNNQYPPLHTRVAQISGQGRHGDCSVNCGAKFLWVLSMELSSGQSSGAWNVKVAERFLEN